MSSSRPQGRLRQLVPMLLAAAALAGYSRMRHRPAMPRPAKTAETSTLRWEDVVLRAGATVSNTATPLRFGQPIHLPNADGAWPPDGPPQAYVQHRLCAQDDAMWKRLGDAVANLPVGDPAVTTLGSMVAGCPGAPCAGALQRARKTQGSGALHAVALHALRYCPGPEVRAVLDSPAAPPSVVLEWALHDRVSRTGNANQWPLLETLLKDAMSRDDGMDLRLAAIAVGDHNGAAGVEALPKAHAQAAPQQRHAIAMGLMDSRDARALAITHAACAAKPQEPLCSHRNQAAETPDAAWDESEVSSRAAAQRLKQDPSSRPALMARLKTTVKTGGEGAATALRVLASVDRAEALALVRSVSVERDDWRRTVNALKRIPDRPTAVKMVSARGVPCVLGEDTLDQALLEDWMQECGASHFFDVETDTFPNAHDGLLAQLALLGGEAWRDMVFEEVPPPEDDGKAPYRLTGYGWGRRFDVSARNQGDWYDLDAVLGLLNDMAADHKLAMRWVVLDTGGQEALVVAGDEAWLKQAWEDGLLNPVGPGHAEQTGKAFEDLVRQKLEDGELRLGQ